MRILAVTGHVMTSLEGQYERQSWTDAQPAMLEFEVRVMRAGALLLGTSCMSGMPAATMRAMNSSGSMVRDVAFTVSMKDAAEYCEAHSASQQASTVCSRQGCSVIYMHCCQRDCTVCHVLGVTWSWGGLVMRIRTS